MNDVINGIRNQVEIQAETRCMFNFSPLKNINVRELFNYHMHKIPVLKEIIND